MVFSTIRVMMKYSKGVETTTLQILYLKLSISFGMYLSRGLAEMAKSMQDFCKNVEKGFSNFYFICQRRFGCFVDRQLVGYRF